MLSKIESLAKSVKHQVQKVEATDDQGKKIPALLIKTGNFQLVAYELEGCLTIQSNIMIDPKDGDALNKRPDDRDRLFSIMKMEMLEGRTGFQMQFKDGKLTTIVLSQRLVAEDESAQTMQRYLDGVQEIIVVTVRVTEILGSAFGAMNSAPKCSPSEFMYH